MGWWEDVWIKKASNWMFHIIRQDPEIQANKPQYLSCHLRSMWIPYVRKGVNKFYGAVHSNISVPHLSGKSAVFQTVTTPDRLKDVDPKSMDRVIQWSHRLLGPVPYWGGDVEFEIGLFAIKSENLVAPFLDILADISKAAGVGAIETALPFISSIQKGFELLTMSQGNMGLEIGIHANLDKITPGLFLVVGIEANKLNPDILKVDNQFQILDDNEKPLRDFPYLIFEVSTESNRNDWFSLPKFSELYSELQDVVGKGRIKESREALAVFRRNALMSPDLLPEDAESIIYNLEKRINKALEPSLTGKKVQRRLPRLEEIVVFNKY